MTMEYLEYRGSISIPGIHSDHENEWMALIEHIDGELGPVASWETPDVLRLTLACDAPNPVEAARIMLDATIAALKAVNLTRFAPTTLDLEDVTYERDRELALA